MCDLTVRTGPWGDRYGEVPGGLTLDVDQGRAARHRPRARWCRASRRSCTPRRASSSWRRRTCSPTCPASCARIDAPARVARAGEPPPRALQELVDAQRRRAGEGQGPLHAAHPPGRRRPLRRRRRPTGARHLRGRHDRGAGRGERRDDAAASSACPTAGATTSPAPACRSRATTRASTTTCSRHRSSST